MQVLLTCHRYPPDGIAGVERYTQTLAAELTRAGDAVSIVTRRPTAEPAEPRNMRERLPDGATLHRLIGGGLSADPSPVRQRRLEQLFDAVLVESAPEVVHINHLLDLSPRFIEIAQRRGAAIVLTLHDFHFACPRVHLQKPSGELCAGPDGGRECARSCFAGTDTAASLRWGLRCGYFRRLLGGVERIICPSQYIAAYFEAFGAEPERVRVIPNGVSIPPAEPAAHWARLLAPERPALRLAFLGSVVAHKGVHVILEALDLAALGSAELLVIGAAPHPEYTRRLRQLAAGISGLEFRMYGAYRPAILPLLLQGVDCAITPSQVPESFSITTREALVRGIPVLVSRLGALPEAVSEGENGFLFDHDQPEQLSALLRRIAGDPGLREHLRRGARKTPVLTATQHAAAIRAVYQEAIALSARGSTRYRCELDELEFFHAELHKLAG